MTTQAKIANVQAQRVRDAVKNIRPSQKDLRRLGKRNVAGVMTGENILKEMKAREEKEKEKAVKKGSRTKKAVPAVPPTSTPSRSTPVTPSRPKVRFPLHETPSIRILRSAIRSIPQPNYYLPPVTELEDNSDAESLLSTTSSEWAYRPRTTTTYPKPDSTPPVVPPLTMSLRSRI
ncbi:hypothetical protein K440DRAFT_8746 [Wilcoxina mikolae CBS 423.85]|nr:hypothetical protein K440DRAFT_8746 [Wilcoxina mikolae CBS 423.85]